MTGGGANAAESTRLYEIVSGREREILSAWVSEQLSGPARDLIGEADLRERSKNLLSSLTAALRDGSPADVNRPEWAACRSVLKDISRDNAVRGLSPVETAMFVFSLRGALMDQLQAAFGAEPHILAAEMRACSVLVDNLGLWTTEVAVGAREEIIKKQQEEMLELSTPVVRLFPGILGLPLIGTLDSARTQIVMENLLQRIVETESTIAIIDITGVPTVDTLVAQHLLKTVAATRLMGADCIISGIRPHIAQTIVHLGVELQNVATKATLADALALALQKIGMKVIRDTAKDPQ
jgi:rsbT co-antagonist protein RsbR